MAAAEEAALLLSGLLPCNKITIRDERLPLCILAYFGLFLVHVAAQYPGNRTVLPIIAAGPKAIFQLQNPGRAPEPHRPDRPDWCISPSILVYSRSLDVCMHKYAAASSWWYTWRRVWGLGNAPVLIIVIGRVGRLTFEVTGQGSIVDRSMWKNCHETVLKI